MPKATRLLLCALVISGSAVARADDRGAVTAENLFRDGRRAADEGNYAVACEKFEASHKLDPAPGTLLNLADCEETRGQLTRAWHDFLQLADGLPELDERKAVALERARVLERSMPKLRVRLARTSAAAHVFRDDVELGDMTLGVTLPVDPGRHVIVVRASGFHDQVYTLSVSRNEERDVQVERGAERTDARRPLAFAIGGLGVASLVAATTTGVFALSTQSASNAECMGSVCSNQDGVNKHNDARNFALASDITLGVGVALVATSIIMLVVSNGKHPIDMQAVARF